MSLGVYSSFCFNMDICSRSLLAASNSDRGVEHGESQTRRAKWASKKEDGGVWAKGDESWRHCSLLWPALREVSRCASYLPRSCFMIFTLICTDRDGARELHSCHLYVHLEPTALISPRCRSRDPSFRERPGHSREPGADRRAQWAPYDFGSGVFCQRQTRARHG